MAQLKTQANDASVEAFINNISPDEKQKEARELLEIFSQVSGFEPQMWGKTIIGFGQYKYVYASGRSGVWMLTGFSPRKAQHSLYIMSGFEKLGALLEKLGPHKIGKGCLYVKKLADVDEEVLRKIIKQSIEIVKKRYQAHN